MSAMRPFILIPADRLTVDGEIWYAASQQYIEALCYSCDTIPFILPCIPDSIDFSTLMDQIDGIVLSGAISNVQPHLYGAKEDPEKGPFDIARDATNLPIIKAALKKNIPLLAICRGLQELNVALGGTLQHNFHLKPEHQDHRAPQSKDRDEKFAMRQNVRLTKGGFLEKLLQKDTLLVNSLHRQAIDRLAPALTIEAISEDNIIEAVRVKDASSFALGFQWHPEYWLKKDPNAGKIFQAFSEAVHMHAKQKNIAPSMHTFAGR